MKESMVKLHPDSYIKLEIPLVFYISTKNSEDIVKTFVATLRNQKSTLVISGKKERGGEWLYSLLTRSFCMKFKMSGDHDNFSVTHFSEDSRARSRFDDPYTKMFLIEPAADVYYVYGNAIYSVKSDAAANMPWNMDHDKYIALIRQMNDFFEGANETKNSKKAYGKRFEANVLNPFRNYTAKERYAEESKAGENEGLSYSKRNFIKRHDKGSSYAFYSNDPNADPEKAFFSVGNKITLFNSDGTKAQTGILYDIDSESSEEVIFSIDFFFQTNDSEIPESGKMVIAYNDTQDKVREGVIKSMEISRIPSQYMYRTFADFSVDGYSEPKDDLVQFIGEKLKTKYPPNQMQLEAIIKGLLTKDMLLVLGPPGTGKTTVIGTWVEYFIKQGKRVLISSQNNAAVDNVLERFKGSGEIVRLGQEAKVQENCREFLPFNKLRSMRTACEKNNLRITEALDADLEKIVSYRNILIRFGEFIENYIIRKAAWDSECRSFTEHSEKLLNFKKSVDDSLNAVEELLEERSRKIIFLEECRKKNPIVRFFIKRQIRYAEKEIRKSDVYLDKLRADYKSSVERYNDESMLLRSCVEEIHRNNSYNAFVCARNQINEFVAANNIIKQNADGSFTGRHTLDLQSELRSQYESVEFDLIPWNNGELVKKELSAIQSLERSASDLKLIIGDWKTCIESGKNDIFEEILLGTCQIVGATCIGINSNRKFAHVDFDVAIVDESGQIQIHNALVPMSRAPITLMLGDYKQIPPCANDEVIAACVNEDINTDLLKMSFFEYLFESMRKAEIGKLTSDDTMTYEEAKAHILKPVLAGYIPSEAAQYTTSDISRMIAGVTADGKKLVNLNSQFRMPGEISNIISEWFYENNYYSSYDKARFSPMVPGTDKPAVIVRTSDSPDRFEEQPANKMGYYNDYEAMLIADVIEKVILSQPEDQQYAFCEKISENIGIISAYGAQVRRIREHLSRRGLNIEESQIRSMVASLDSFQGQERPLIIYSLTRSKSPTHDPTYARVGFMKELRRLNVAFTRCKKQLVIIGDIDYLQECMYVKADDTTGLPCSGETDERITLAQINQCAECPVMDCERKFARFMRLLMQHITNSASPSGNLIDASELKNIMNGGRN